MALALDHPRTRRPTRASARPPPTHTFTPTRHSHPTPPHPILTPPTCPQSRCSSSLRMVLSMEGMVTCMYARHAFTNDAVFLVCCQQPREPQSHRSRTTVAPHHITSRHTTSNHTAVGLSCFFVLFQKQSVTRTRCRLCIGKERSSKRRTRNSAQLTHRLTD